MSLELRTVMRDGSIYAVAGMVSRLAGLVFIPVYMRVLSVEEFVFYTVMVAVTEIGAMLMSLGLAGALARFYFEHGGDEAKRRRVVSTILLTVGALATAIVTVSVVISPVVSGIVFISIAPPESFGLAMIAVATTVFFELINSYYLVQKRPFVVLSLAIIKVLTLIAFNVLFVVVLDCGVTGILFALIASFGLTNLPFLIAIFTTNGLHLDGGIALQAFRFGLPLVPSASANAAMRLFERQILAAQGGIGAALFGLADRIASLLTVFFATPFSRIFLVRRFETLAKDQNQDELSRILGLFICLMSVASLGMVVTGPELLLIIAPDNYLPAVGILPFLALSYMLASLTNNIELGLLYTKRTGVIPLIAMVSLGLSLTLNLILIPRFGVIGAGTSAVVVGVLRLIATIEANRRMGTASVTAPWPLVSLVLLVGFALGLLTSQDGLVSADLSARVFRLVIWICFVLTLLMSPAIDRQTKKDVMVAIKARRGAFSEQREAR